MPSIHIYLYESYLPIIGNVQFVTLFAFVNIHSLLLPTIRSQTSYVPIYFHMNIDINEWTIFCFGKPQQC